MLPPAVSAVSALVASVRAAATAWSADCHHPAAGCAAIRPVRPSSAATYFVPGYAPDRAWSRGRPVAEDPVLAMAVPAGWEGSLTLVSRADERDGTLRRAVFPLAGHEITLSPDGLRAVFNSLNDPHCVTFDPTTLEPGGIHTRFCNSYGLAGPGIGHRCEHIFWQGNHHGAGPAR